MTRSFYDRHPWARIEKPTARRQRPKKNAMAGVIPAQPTPPTVASIPARVTRPPNFAYSSWSVKDDVGTHTIPISLTRGADAADEFTLTFSGTATEGVDYTPSLSGLQVLSGGETNLDVTITVTNHGEFFLEKYLDLEITPGSTTRVEPGLNKTRLWIRPAADPPTIDFEFAASGASSPSVQNVSVELSAASMEPVTLYYSTSGSAVHSVPDSGTLTIAAGETTGQIPVTISSVGDVVLDLDYERAEVDYSIQLGTPITDGIVLQDGDVTSEGFPIQEVHLDENLWGYTDQTALGDEQRNTHGKSPFIPGQPTDNFFDGTTTKGGEYAPMRFVLPDVPVLSPLTGESLARMELAPEANLNTGYIRKSFGQSDCGGPLNGFEAKEYVRVAFYVALHDPSESEKDARYFRIGVRNRLKDTNHWVMFDRLSTGVDKDDNPVSTTSTSIGDIGYWDENDISGPTTSYGIVEDSIGVMVWFIHRFDGSTEWSTGNMDEVGDAANPIHYPTEYSSGSDTMPAGGLAEVRGLGHLPFGFWLEWSDTVLSGPPARIWPKPARWWEPRGLAAMASAGQNQHTITVS